MMAVSGVFRSCETLVISSVFMFWLRTSAATAFSKPARTWFNSSFSGSNRPMSPSTGVARSPPAMRRAAASRAA